MEVKGTKRKAALNFRKVFAKKFCTKIICVFHRFSAQNILLSMRVSIYLSLHTYLSIFLYTWTSSEKMGGMCFWASTIPLLLTISLFIYLPIHPSTYLSCLSIFLWIYLSVYQSFYIYIHIYLLSAQIYARTSSKKMAGMCFWGEYFSFPELPKVDKITLLIYKDKGKVIIIVLIITYFYFFKIFIVILDIISIIFNSSFKC